MSGWTNLVDVFQFRWVYGRLFGVFVLKSAQEFRWFVTSSAFAVAINATTVTCIYELIDLPAIFSLSGATALSLNFLFLWLILQSAYPMNYSVVLQI